MSVWKGGLWASQRYPNGGGPWKGGLWRSQRLISATQRLINTLFSEGQQGVFYVPQPVVDGQQVLFTDAAGTTPVTADGDPVGLMVDLSGNGNHASQATSAARPIYRTDGTLHWLEFDGVDNQLHTGLVDFSAYQKAFVCKALDIVSPVVPSSANIIFEFSEKLQRGGVTTHLEYQDGYVSTAIKNDTNNILGYSRTSGQHVISSLIDYSATGQFDQIVMREDGAQKALSVQFGLAQTPVQMGNYTINIGARDSNGVSNPSNASLHGLVFCSGHAGVNVTEGYLANLAGVTL